MAKAYEKLALQTGVGALFLDFMETEETPSTEPTYAGEVKETPSLQSINIQKEVTNSPVYLSNILHSDLSSAQSVTIPVTAGYLPRNFAEEAQGMVKIGGAWAMPTNPKAKYFRLGVPITDENGDEIIVNIPKCRLEPVAIEGQTEEEQRNAQMQTFNITGQPLLMPVTTTEGRKYFTMHTIDMSDTENQSTYDRDKLLELGWYDEASLALCEESTP